MKREKQPIRSSTKHWKVACAGVVLIVGCLFFRRDMYNLMHCLQDYRARALYVVRDFFLAEVYRENDALHKRIATLEAEIGALQYLRLENRRLLEQCHVEALDQRDTIGARIIENNIQDFQQHIIIDVGEEHGVSRGDVVVCGYNIVDGGDEQRDMQQSVALVGVIADVYRSCSKVLLAIDRNCSVPVKFSSNDRNAMLKGNNGAYSVMMKHEDYVLEEGEIALTSGCGGVFPPGMTVGTVLVRNGLLDVVAPINFDALSFVCVLRSVSRESYVA